MSLSRIRLILAGSLVIAGIAFSHAAAADPAQWARGQILVKPKGGVGEESFLSALAQAGAGSKGKLRAMNVHLVSVPPHAEQAMVEALSHNPLVEFAELDELVAHEATSANDTYYSNAWHLQTMNAPLAWDQSLGDGVVVAVLDTGVDPDHPDLAGKLVPGWNVYGNNADSSDVYGHGTKVAGVIAAASNNGMGVTSLAWDAMVMPVRISQDNGWAYFSTIANGITWAADHGANVANISYYVSNSSTVQNAANYLRGKGGVVVSSAGNDGTMLSAPDTDAIITVGATDSGDNKTSWSNYGDSVDVTAPGAGIWTTSNGGGYGGASGTSFSSPATAAVVALVMAANPSLTPAQVDAVITGSSVDLGSPGRDVYFGHGRVDAAAAVAAAGGTAQDPQPEPDSQAPTVSISPGSSQTYTSAQTLTISASASDNEGVSSVDFYRNGSLVESDTSAPYSTAWSIDSADNGSHTWQAVARDAAGNRTSDSVILSVNIATPDTEAPTVSITSPGEGTLSGTVTISASASDNIGVTSVKFYVNGALASTDSSAPYTHNWDTTGSDNGAVQLQARAYDAAGNEASSQTVTVTVDNPSAVEDTVPPTVVILNPNATTVSGTVKIGISASDNVAVASVHCYIDNTLKSSAAGDSLECSWNTRKESGFHTIMAVAEDSSGNMASTSIQVEVVKDSGGGGSGDGGGGTKGGKGRNK